jgi:heme exporter protein D
MKEFLSMGGYGFYVWGSYVVTFVLLAIEVVLLQKRARKARGHPDEAKA